MIVNLRDLTTTPCHPYFKYFDNKEESVNILEVFKREGEHWEWLFIFCSNFDWFDPEKFDWSGYGYLVPKYCPQHFDAHRYNWNSHTWAVKEHCPHLLKCKK